jgi:restriction system protein
MTLWLVRAGRFGEAEQDALDKGLVTIGWNKLPDLSGCKSRDELINLYKKTYPDAKKMTTANEAGQVWAFKEKIKKGDTVALPLKHQSAISIGEVIGDYEYHLDFGDLIHHIRRVKWLKTIARSEFDQDLLYSLGAFMTVCQIKRNDAEERIMALVRGTKLPKNEEELEESEVKIDIEQASRDEISKHIIQKFNGHDLARLVNALLQTQGYTTSQSSPGPDGGVDILAGAGQHGFDEPKICVQVKSGSSPVDAPTLRHLQGTMSNFGASQGLMVSWGGFTNKAIEEARRNFFKIRLWDEGKLLDEVLEHFDRLPDTIKAELPLKRIWTLVREEEE